MGRDEAPDEVLGERLLLDDLVPPDLLIYNHTYLFRLSAYIPQYIFVQAICSCTTIFFQVICPHTTIHIFVQVMHEP